MEMLQQLPGLSFKAFDVNEIKGTFQALASTFGNVDRQNDVIDYGAFRKAIADAYARKQANKSPALYALLWMHQQNSPVGSVLDAKETPKGLLISCQADLNTTLGRDAFSSIKAGCSGEFSIGYKALKSHKDANGVRHVTEVRLDEVSLITRGFAANLEAVVDMASVKTTIGGASNMNLEQYMEGARRIMREMRAHMHGADAAGERVSYPDAAAYVNEEQYEQAAENRLAERMGLKPDPEGRMAAMDAELARHQDANTKQRVALGQQVPVADLTAYARRHDGKLPDNRPLPDMSATNRAIRQTYAELAKLPRRRDED
jgi:HK97 family phage prohead protease